MSRITGVKYQPGAVTFTFSYPSELEGLALGLDLCHDQKEVQLSNDLWSDMLNKMCNLLLHK